MDSSQFSTEESDDWELWSSFDSSQTLFSSSPVPTPEDSATRRLKRKYDSEDFLEVPAKKIRTEAPKLSFTATTARNVEGTEPFIIAGFQNPQDQETLAIVSGIPTGVIWEIARLVSMGRLTGVSLEDLKQLKGDNKVAAPRVVETLLNEKVREIDAAFAAERKSQCPWAELDLEEKAIRLNPNAALGNCPEYPQGHGGKVCFSGTIEAQISEGKNKGIHSVKVVLDRCTLTSSCRLCRRFGSTSFLRLKIPSKILHSHAEGLREFFLRPFVLFGAVFRSFYAKDGTVFLFKTRERFTNDSIKMFGSTYDHHLPLFEFLDQFNPLHLNSKQLLCKWASRFALGLSNSAPGPVLNPVEVEENDDIISPADSNMTDGCGLSNPAFNLKLRRDFKLDSTPCAVQIRHGGRKGMLLMAPDSSEDPTPRVAFRKPSQIKINYSEEEKAHPANATMDILRFSRTRTPARISPEVIINLEHNGVPAAVFEDMQDAYLAEGNMFKLWDAVEKSEGVCLARRIRQAGSEIRFRGTGDRFADTTQDDDEEEPETFDKAVHERSTAWWPDYISGQPSSLAETVMGLIDAGFTPQALPVLRDKLKQVVKTKIKYRSQHFRYDVAHSASAFVVPDFWAVLGEDEIHFKSSRREFKVIGDLETDIIVGEVLMTRNPCKVPTDVRKLRAVKHQALHDIVDVIVCSVAGNRRLLDFLAGGDYDGDTSIVIWDKIIVDAFVNADEKHSIEPAGVNACFTRDDTTVEKFIADNAQQPPEVKAMELQKYLLGSLRDASAVGQYSTYHDNSIVTRGYENPRTVKLAYQFCKILDSPKTGYKIKPKTRMRTIKADNPMLSRPFIMEVLNQAAVRQEDRWLADAEQLFLPFETSAPILDRDLAQPWEQYLEFAAKHARAGNTKPNDDLAIIAEHVQADRKSNSFTERKIEVRQDTLRMLSREFAAFPTADSLVTICDPVLIARLRASYAYLYDHRQYSGYGRRVGLVSRGTWRSGSCAESRPLLSAPSKAVSVRFYERFKIGGDKRT
ncbi:RNA dependent RNA polymerase-domain-containing protein [Mycena galericulata]|nr:RNA dependent RNA polymerase-domain-containing protein [Mycena galericulata]